MPSVAPVAQVDELVDRLFCSVREALDRGTRALLSGDRELARAAAEADRHIDDLTAQAESMAWGLLDEGEPDLELVRHVVGVLLILPELERSADLAEHVAQRALTGTGAALSRPARSVVERMSEVALDMWELATDAYHARAAHADELDEADDELDILHGRLSNEVAAGSVPPGPAAQLVLVARFYERLGDHAVNVARRVETLTA